MKTSRQFFLSLFLSFLCLCPLRAGTTVEDNDLNSGLVTENDDDTTDDDVEVDNENETGEGGEDETGEGGENETGEGGEDETGEGGEDETGEGGEDETGEGGEDETGEGGEDETGEGGEDETGEGGEDETGEGGKDETGEGGKDETGEGGKDETGEEAPVYDFKFTVDNNAATVTGFAEGVNISALTIPDSVEYEGTSYLVTAIDDGAFSYRSNLTALTFPSGLTAIGERAFQGCSGLTGALTLPPSLTAVGERAFQGCNGLTGTLALPSGLTAVGNQAFESCSGLTALTFPPTLTAVGEKAFQDCSGLTGALTLPIGLIVINNQAFSGCSGLTALTFPAILTTIGERSFQGCSGLDSLTLPEGLTAIGDYAFGSCSGLTSVILQPATPPALGESAFASVYGCKFTCPENTFELYRADLAWEQYFPYDFDFNIVEVDGASTAIVTGFSNGTVPLFTIPDTVLSGGVSYPVTEIGTLAFSGCSELTALTLPAGLIAIGGSAFSGCSGLTSLTFPEDLTAIGDYAFYGCSGLTALTFPEGLTAIGDYAFHGCSGLTAVTLQSATSPSLGGNAFVGVPDDCEFTCPDDALNLYRADPAWEQYFPYDFDFNIVEVDVASTAIITGFSNGPIPLFTIPDTVLSGGVSYPVTEIGTLAFSGYSELTALTLPAGLIAIGGSAFSGCSGLTTLTFPEGLTAIGDYAFSECSGLTTLTFPEGLTAIGDYAFHGCSGLTAVTLQSATPPSLGGNAFVGVPDDCEFTCPDDALALYQADEAWIPYFGDGTAIQAIVGGNGEGVVSLYDLRGQLLRRTSVTLPASPAALRTALGVPAGLYILATPDGTRKVKL